MLLVFFNLLLIALYSFTGFVMFMCIQLISFQIFKFNLYKWILKKLQVNF